MLSHTTLWKTALAAALCVAAFSQPGRAQAQPASVLRIDTVNAVVYIEDTADISKFATDPNVTTPSVARNFTRAVAIADIQAVNGQRVMGLHTRMATGISTNPAPTPGQAIADVVRATTAVINFEILKSDGTPIGTIMASGFGSGAAPPPGSPARVAANNYAITGGTGAFFGARGQVGTEAPPPGVAVQRGTSMTEDPANRRRNGGGTQRWVIHLIPMSVPQIAALLHEDFSLVTPAKPARPGEVLIVSANGLGPTAPGVDPGQPFPAQPFVQVNSPVAVTVNGSSAEVINAIGWPGLVDTYRVDFRVPSGITTGMASIQIAAAWIVGPEVRVAVQ
jgi:uncharacterized protein (TIGR03437 family)